MTFRKRSKKEDKVRYLIPKAAAGGSGSGGDGPGGGDGYEAGQILTCKIRRNEPGGYSVEDVSNGYPGFLASDQKYIPGEKVQTQFVCIDKARLLLIDKFSAETANSSDWLQELEDLDGVYRLGLCQKPSEE